MSEFQRKLNGIITVLILILTGFLCLYLMNVSAVFLLLAGVLLLGIALGYAILLPRKIVVILHGPDQIHKKDRVVYDCDVELVHFYPVFHACLIGELWNHTTREVEKLCIPFGIFKRKRITFEVQAEHVGVMECSFSKVEVYGLLSLFRRSIPVYEKYQRAVYPELVNLPMEFKTDPIFTENGEEVIMGPHGYDSAIYDGVHPYQEGDSLKWIHWNLTGKTDEYMVRELGRPATVLPGLFFESSLYRFDLNQLDRLFGVYVSISLQMLSQNLYHEWIFWDEDKAEWMTYRVNKAEDVDAALLSLGLCPLVIREHLTIPELPSYLWSRYNQMTYVADLPKDTAGDVMELAPIPMNLLVGEEHKWNYYDAVL